MELTKENSFDPTPRLKSSPIPIKFISFNDRVFRCIYCKETYFQTLHCPIQKYCKKCLSNYINDITDINIYLDVHYSMSLECTEHEIRSKEPQVIQECCRKCLTVLCFKQVLEYSIYSNAKYGQCCILCGRLLYQGTNIFEIIQFKLCSKCYLISCEYTKSTLTKKLIPIICLPWWHNISFCVACDRSLTFTSNCQKYCQKCLIFYIGCRYCLTTNIIFGLTTQSQCKKCERISFVIVDILTGNSELDDFILNLNPDIYNNLGINEFLNIIKNNDKYFLPLEINPTIHFICQKVTQSKVVTDESAEKFIEWIPYSQFTNVKEIILANIFGRVKIKYEIRHHIVRIHGVTRHPKLGDYMQKYCKRCLLSYLASMAIDNYTYLDVYYSMKFECIRHELMIKAPQFIQECCRSCLEVLFFRQIFEQNADEQFKLRSDCYLISTGYIKLTKKSIPVIYLPWWHNISCCVACNKSLIFTSDCQKYCEDCLIFHFGCRHCLTTNIIFGLTTQSQCKKCKRRLSIIVNILSGNSDIDDFFINLTATRYDNLKTVELVDKIKKIDKYFLPSEINSTIKSICQNYKITQPKTLINQSEKLIEWIPYSQLTDIIEIVRGRVGIIYYHATWIQRRVILKKFKDSQDTNFLNELKSNCYEIKNHIIGIYGITKEPEHGDYMIVIQYASGRDLRDWFNQTPKLQSSPISIKFISFNENDYKCIYCKEEYTKAFFSISERCYRYCKKCLSSYLTYITDINIYLDIYTFTWNLGCNEHEISRIKGLQNIQRCCENCFSILCFEQISVNDFYLNNSSMTECNIYNNVVENEKFCKLCGKSLYQERIMISYEYIESPLTKKSTPIIHLPWWHNISCCVACNKSLMFTSDCQKFCEECLIFYVGCRFCLTTNLIFGITTQSQCKKCKRVSSITASILSGHSELDDFILNLDPDIYNNLIIDKISDKITENNYLYSFPSKINSFIHSMCKNYKKPKSKELKNQSEKLMKWIPYSQFTNVVKIARGGFGIIYRATWMQGNVILKKFKNSQYTSKYFLNELKSNQNCYEIKHHIIRTHGITKAPKLGDYMLVMQYASGGDLYNWLQKNFAKITWNKDKLIILWQISEGLETIHKADYIHRDFHSGNILCNLLNDKRHQWLIGDLELSQPANNTSNNEIYGVIPYVAPEIFRGSPFSKESDVYCMGMIMWELTTGCKPFADVEHDHQLIYKILDGERPEITEDTPECYARLMKSCWDPDPEKRPLAKIIRNTFGSWSFRNKHNYLFNKAELKRLELLKSKKLGPQFAKKPHPKAIYTSRPLCSIISKCSSTNSYMSIDLEFDINIESRSLGVPTTSRKRKIEELNI
ncbi:kinase-like domain-containing protein [Rhizophagus clarus]|uniref:Kinase-like domain-containing protein n=1 Tax=Rhizophagus clarus TaxID=94130 RepID=A0A8H3LY52_9GLOM|nr:kinase-like domain-containing protein [Rhizophagus clarus]